MILPDAPPPLEPVLRRLGRRRLQARLILSFERLWPALWPALGLAGLFLIAGLLDLLPFLPGWAHATVLGLVGLGFLALLLHGLRRIVWPDAPAADRRLEAASGLKHRPLQALTDQPARLNSGGAGGDTLWRAHIARTAAQIKRLRTGIPRPGLAAIDRRALRGGLVVGLVAAVGIAGWQAPGRLARAVTPQFALPAPPPAMLLQAWITPPAYTGIAPVFLKSDGGAATVPAGSRLSLSLSGGAGEPALTLAGRGVELKALDTTSFQAELDLQEGGRLALTRNGSGIAGWDLTVVADIAPVVSFPEPPGATRARIPQTRLPWQVSHAYGVVALQAELRLRDRPDTPPVIVPIPLPSTAPKAARGARVQDLTAHPWAGLPVTGRLSARNAPGLIGTSADAEFDLPERAFQHPVARSLMAMRKQLTLNPDVRDPILRELDRLSTLPDVWEDDTAGFLNLRGINGLIRRDNRAERIPEAQERMWELALHVEEGAPERTARSLEQARERLREAMEQERRDAADPERNEANREENRAEVEKRMRELEEALRKNLEALADQARRDPDSRAYDPQAHEMDVRDMKKLSEEMRDAARDNKMDTARDKLAELERMLDEMKNQRPERGKMTERERQRAEKRQKGAQQMNVLQDMVKREGALLDKSQGRAEADAPSPANRFGPQPRRTEPGSPSSTEQRNAERAQEQKVQQALRRVLGELMQQQGDLTGKVPPALCEADTAMRDAIAALGQGRDQPAAGFQQRAIEALQKGGREMNQQMAQQFGRPGQEPGDEEGEDGEGQEGQEGQEGNGMAGNEPGQGQQPGNGQQWSDRGRGRPGQGRTADRRADERRDPLGRSLKEGNAGLDESGDVKVPDEMERARTRAIQEELRRRSAERERPQPELDYIERLLRQF